MSATEEDSFTALLVDSEEFWDNLPPLYTDEQLASYSVVHPHWTDFQGQLADTAPADVTSREADQHLPSSNLPDDSQLPPSGLGPEPEPAETGAPAESAPLSTVLSANAPGSGVASNVDLGNGNDQLLPSNSQPTLSGFSVDFNAGFGNGNFPGDQALPFNPYPPSQPHPGLRPGHSGEILLAQAPIGYVPPGFYSNAVQASSGSNGLIQPQPHMTVNTASPVGGPFQPVWIPPPLGDPLWGDPTWIEQVLSDPQQTSGAGQPSSDPQQTSSVEQPSSHTQQTSGPTSDSGPSAARARANASLNAAVSGAPAAPSARGRGNVPEGPSTSSSGGVVRTRRPAGRRTGPLDPAARAAAHWMRKQGLVCLSCKKRKTKCTYVEGSSRCEACDKVRPGHKPRMCFFDPR